MDVVLVFDRRNFILELTVELRSLGKTVVFNCQLIFAAILLTQAPHTFMLCLKINEIFLCQT